MAVVVFDGFGIESLTPQSLRRINIGILFEHSEEMVDLLVTFGRSRTTIRIKIE